MNERAWRGISIGCALILGATIGCDGGKSTSLGTGGTAATNAGGGTGATAPATTCARSSECTDQVCSPDGRCVDCYDTRDCLANQHCDAEHCVADGGDTGGSSIGGSSMGGSISSGGSVGSGGSVSGGNACSGAQVLFVIQRSGAMFEEPDADANYWSMVESAVTAEDGALSGYAGKLDVGALFFVRLQYEEDMTCPVVSSAAPAGAGLMPLRELFQSNATAYQALADEQAKMDAPVPEAVAAGASLVTGAARHLVLITTAVPDSCTVADTNCAVDLAVKAVQDASQQGVVTHVIGLGNTQSLNAGQDQDGYTTYLTQLANAGAGKPVKMSAAFDDQCSHDSATAKYSEQSGDAHAYRAESAADIKTAVTEILHGICP
jgi:hypothetical protein